MHACRRDDSKFPSQKNAVTYVLLRLDRNKPLAVMPAAEAFTAYFDRCRSLEAHPSIMGGSVSTSCMPSAGVHTALKIPTPKDRSVRTSAFGPAQTPLAVMPAAEAFTTYFDRCRSLEAHPSIMGGSVITSCIPADGVHSKIPPKRPQGPVLLCSDRHQHASLIVCC